MKGEFVVIEHQTTGQPSSDILQIELVRLLSKKLVRFLTATHSFFIVHFILWNQILNETFTILFFSLCLSSLFVDTLKWIALLKLHNIAAWNVFTHYINMLSFCVFLAPVLTEQRFIAWWLTYRLICRRC